MRAFIVIVIAVVLGLFLLIGNGPGLHRSTAPEPEFKAGDVVEIEEPGISCFSGQAHLLNAIALDREGWSKELQSDCGETLTIDGSKPYEIMMVGSGAGPYEHVYCINDVEPFPTNKSGCVWAAFPLGKTHLSSCKAGPERVGPPKPMPPPGPHDRDFDVAEHPAPARMACMGHYRS